MKKLFVFLLLLLAIGTHGATYYYTWATTNTSDIVTNIAKSLAMSVAGNFSTNPSTAVGTFYSDLSVGGNLGTTGSGYWGGAVNHNGSIQLTNSNGSIIMGGPNSATVAAFNAGVIQMYRAGRHASIGPDTNVNTGSGFVLYGTNSESTTEHPFWVANAEAGVSNMVIAYFTNMVRSTTNIIQIHGTNNTYSAFGPGAGLHIGSVNPVGASNIVAEGQIVTGQNGQFVGNGTGLTNLNSAINLVIATKTSNYSVLAGDTGTVFNNNGAGAAVTNSLPASTPGLNYSLDVVAAQNFAFKANGTDTIRNAGSVSAAGGLIFSSTVGTQISIRCNVAGKWVVYAAVGTITVQ